MRGYRSPAARRAASSADDLGDAMPLRLAHVQAALRAPPQHVLGRARPLVLHKVTQLALRQPGAIVFAQLTVAEHARCLDAVAAENAAHDELRKLTIALEHLVARGGAPGEFAARQLDSRRPWRLHGRKVRRELLEGVLGEPTIGG